MHFRLSLFTLFMALFLVVPFLSYAEIEHVDVNKADEYIKSGEYILIDVREPDEYKAGHIKGADNIDFYDDFETLFESKYKDKNKGYILYCRSGKRSEYSAEILDELGYTKIINVKGGFLSWQDAGKPVEK